MSNFYTLLCKYPTYYNCGGVVVRTQFARVMQNNLQATLRSLQVSSVTNSLAYLNYVRNVNAFLYEHIFRRNKICSTE